MPETRSAAYFNDMGNCNDFNRIYFGIGNSFWWILCIHHLSATRHLCGASEFGRRNCYTTNLFLMYLQWTTTKTKKEPEIIWFLFEHKHGRLCVAPSKRRHSNQIDIFELIVSVYLSNILYAVFYFLLLCSVTEINICFHIHVIRLFFYAIHTSKCVYTCFFSAWFVSTELMVSHSYISYGYGYVYDMNLH